MATYLIFDAATGEPVQTHVEPGGLRRSRREILAEAGAGEERDDLELIVVDPDHLTPGCRVDVETGRVVPGKEAGPAGGGAGGDVGVSDTPSFDVRTRYVRGDPAADRDRDEVSEEDEAG